MLCAVMPSAAALQAQLLLLLQAVYAPLGVEWPKAPKGEWAKAAKGAADSVAIETISSLIAENTVVIFSGSKCSQSKRVKSYFEDEGIPFYALELDQRQDGEALKLALHERTGSSKTPAVYIRGHLVGGSSDVGRAYKSGELKHWTEAEEATARKQEACKETEGAKKAKEASKEVASQKG